MLTQNFNRPHETAIIGFFKFTKAQELQKELLNPPTKLSIIKRDAHYNNSSRSGPT